MTFPEITDPCLHMCAMWDTHWLLVHMCHCRCVLYMLYIHTVHMYCMHKYLCYI